MTLAHGRLATCGALLVAAVVLAPLAGLLITVAALVALDGLLPHAGAAGTGAPERFRRQQHARVRDAVRRRLTGRGPAGELRLLAPEPGAERADLGVQVIDVASVTATVEPAKARQFDAAFRADASARDRWQTLWAAQARGVALPPVEVYRVGAEHVLVDGHHRVSVARDQGVGAIDARVVELRPRTR